MELEYVVDCKPVGASQQDVKGRMELLERNVHISYGEGRRAFRLVWGHESQPVEIAPALPNPGGKYKVDVRSGCEDSVKLEKISAPLSYSLDVEGKEYTLFLHNF